MKGGINPRERIEVNLPNSAMQEIESTGWDKCTDAAVIRIQAYGPASIVGEQGFGWWRRERGGHEVVRSAAMESYDVAQSTRSLVRPLAERKP